MYNVRWPEAVGAVGPGEADLVIVVDDGHAVDGPDGVARSVAASTGAPLVLARLESVG